MADSNPLNAQQILDKIKKAQSPEERSAQIEAFIHLPQLIDYKLTANDFPLIERGWKLHFSRKSRFSFKAIHSIYRDKGWSIVQIFEQIVSMMDRNIVSSRDLLDCDYHEREIELIHADYHLCSGFAYNLMGLNPIPLMKAILPPKLKDFSELKKVIENTFNKIREFYIESRYHIEFLAVTERPFYYFELIEPLIDLMMSSESIPTVELINSAGLSKEETCIVVVLLNISFSDSYVLSRDYLLQAICKDPADISQLYHLFDPDSRLLKHEILTDCIRMHDIFQDKYMLSFKFRGTYQDITDSFDEAFGNKDKSSQPKAETELTEEEKEEPKTIKLKNPALYHIPIRYNMSSLILPAKDLELLQAAIQRFRTGNSSSLAEWGIFSSRDADGQGKKGLSMLLYGVPGTGKTFAAGAIAVELGKELIGVDCTQLRDMWYGNAEKFVRAWFQEMRRISLEEENPPIFLLNEADQIMTNRSTNPIGGEKVDNAIQNIMLEEMENFPGFLIMTTNLADNIDGAYFRRINIKMELSIPDYECRLRLWKKNLVPTIPGADRIHISQLAKTFVFTGGQISLVVQNACNEAIMREGDERKLTLADLTRYCLLEQPWGSSGKRKPIGFS